MGCKIEPMFVWRLRSFRRTWAQAYISLKNGSHDEAQSKNKSYKQLKMSMNITTVLSMKNYSIKLECIVPY